MAMWPGSRVRPEAQAATIVGLTSRCPNFGWLVGISVRSQNTIDSIYLDYKAPEGRINQEARDKYGHLRCGGDGGRPSPEPPLTLDDGEVIVRVSGRYGELRGEIGEFVNWLYIQTDGGPRGPQFRTFATRGSPGPGTFDFIAPEGTYISGLVIRSCKFIDAVGVILKTRS